MLIPDENSLPIHHLFDQLSAEHEVAWLNKLFLPPSDFDSIVGMRSVVVFGSEGAGKTALKIALLNHSHEKRQNVPLVIEWLPGIPADLDEHQFVAFILRDILNTGAEILTQKIGQNPELFTNAPEFSQTQIIWFLHNYLIAEHDLVLLRFENQFQIHGLDVLKDIFKRQPRTIIPADSPQPKILAEVTDIFQKIGYKSIWVLVDHLDAWLEVDSKRLNVLLKTLFSTLALFEVSGFAFKVMCPEKLKPSIISSLGAERRRFDIYHLKWSPNRLIRLIEIRLAYCLGLLDMQLKDLSDDNELEIRLERYGGNSPRGWLEIIRPLVDEYSRQTHPQPLSLEKTKEIYSLHPPILKLDIEVNQVWIGSKLVNDISASSIRLLRYLYMLPSRSCNKSELYYKGLQELSYMPEVGDPRWEPPKNWNGTMDTALWRLRQAIEVDPKQPIYIVSYRGKGIIKLENSW